MLKIKDNVDLEENTNDKKISMKPIRKRLFYNCRGGVADMTFIYYCPVCNASNVEDMNYCFNCGQKLEKWVENENDY